MFLTAEQTGGPRIFALRRHNFYLAIEMNWRYPRLCDFDINQLAQALGCKAGETWQEHASVIKLACCDGRLFEWLDKIGGKDVRCIRRSAP